MHLQSEVLGNHILVFLWRELVFLRIIMLFKLLMISLKIKILYLILFCKKYNKDNIRLMDLVSLEFSIGGKL